jgi:DNA mismatch endonuclease (patch repair protein)
MSLSESNCTAAPVIDFGRRHGLRQLKEACRRHRRRRKLARKRSDKGRNGDGPSVDAARSRLMAAVRQRATTPEIAVRRCLRTLSFHYKCNRKNLPGSPDLLISDRRIVIFVHGCFWHRHRCRYASTPKTRREWWLEKFAANRKRDRRVQRELRKAGWNVVVIWECWTRDATSLRRRLERVLSTAGCG